MGEEAVRQGVRVLAVAVAAQTTEGEVGLVEPDGVAPVREQVKEELIKRLGRDTIATTEPINEGRLATEFGVSRTPLREALITLEREGVITSERGKGFRFTPLSAQEFRDLSAIVATQEALALESSDPGHLAATATFEIQPPGQVVPSIRRVTIRFGEPLDFSRYASMENQKAAIRAVTDEIMYAILGLSGQEYVDEYAVKVKAAQAEQGGQPQKFPKLRRSRRIRAR